MVLDECNQPDQEQSGERKEILFTNFDSSLFKRKTTIEVVY